MEHIEEASALFGLRRSPVVGAKGARAQGRGNGGLFCRMPCTPLPSLGSGPVSSITCLKVCSSIPTLPPAAGAGAQLGAREPDPPHAVGRRAARAAPRPPRAAPAPRLHLRRRRWQPAAARPRVVTRPQRRAIGWGGAGWGTSLKVNIEAIRESIRGQQRHTCTGNQEASPTRGRFDSVSRKRCL